MKLYKPGEKPIQNRGVKIWLYGQTGVGKTISTLTTAPDPILYILCEGRDAEDFIEIAKQSRKEVRIHYGYYDNWEDLIECFAEDTEKFDKYATIVLDGFTNLSNLSLATEIVDEAWEGKKEEDKRRKKLAGQAKMSEESFGVLGNQLLRFIMHLGRVAQKGKIVICISLLTDKPKYNRNLSAAPALMGRVFPDNFPGEFDLIGIVIPRVKNKVLLYPPYVDFVSDDTFMAKWTGVNPWTEPKPLNIQNILRYKRLAADTTTTNTIQEGELTNETEE